MDQPENTPIPPSPNPAPPGPAAAPPGPRKPLWRRAVRQLLRSLALVVALLLILFACLSALVQTQTGSRWLLGQLSQRLPLEFGEIQGNLIDGLDLGYIDYRAETVHLRIEQPSFRWRLGSLLYGALSIQSLQAAQILVELPQRKLDEDNSAPFNAWPNLRLPLRVELGKMQLQQIQLRQGDSHWAWQSLSGSLSLGTFHLRYNRLALDQGDYRLELTGQSKLDFPYDTSARLKWRVSPRAAAEDNGAAFPYAGSGQLSGDLRQLQLSASSEIPLVLNAEASTRLVDEQQALIGLPQFELSAQWQAQQLPAVWWFPNNPAPTTSAQLKASGNWLGYSAHLDGSLQLPFKGDDGQPLAPVAVSAQVEGDYRQLPQLQLQLEVPQPVPEAAQASQAIQESAPIEASAPPAQPEPDAQDQAQQPQAADSQPAPAQMLQLAGRIAWLPALDWQLQVEGQQLNLGQLLADWPSHLALKAESRGHYDYAAKQWQLALAGLNLEGSLRDLNLEARGGAELAEGQFRSQGLDLIYGANQLHLKGSLAQQLDLHWNLDAPLLGQLDTSLAGSLSSSGQLRGSLNLPQLAVEAKASNLRWRRDSLKQLNISLKPDSSATSAAATTEPAASGVVARLEALLDSNYQLQASAEQLYLGGLGVNSLALSGQGSLNRHRLEAKAKSSQLGSLALALKGSYQTEAGGQWQGQLQSLSLKVNKVPRWQLVSSQPIQLGRGQLQLAPQCFTTRSNLTAALDEEPVADDLAPPVAASSVQLVSANKAQESSIKRLPPPRLCIKGDWQSGQGGGLSASIEAVPLRQFYALFKPEVYLAGVMDGQLQLKGRSFDLADWQGKLNLTGRETELRYQFEGAGTEVYPWRDLQLDAQLAKGKLDASAQLQWQGYGLMEAQAQLDLPAQRFQSSRFQAHFTNLAPLETLLPLMNSLSGDLSADLSLTGPFSQPELLGQIRLRQGQAKVPRLGVDLKAIELQLQALKGGQVELSSSLTSGAGQLTLSGSLSDAANANWQLQGALKGENFSLLNTPQLKLDISPDLTLVANSARLNLRGSALIPWARANIKTLPESSTRVSSDVVVVDDTQSEVREQQQLQEVNVRLVLGEDVTFRGFGLSAKLNGKLNLNKENQRPLITNGYVGVTQGVYKAYGQNLKIERGRLIFQGPFENPGLDIRAQRSIDGADEDTVAGLEISGTLQRPVAKVYSVPAHSESESMLMLLSGKPAGDDSRAQAAVLLGALSGLGGDGTSIISGIASFFRVDELEIKSDSGVDQSQLMIGKYITPRLLVRYMVGLFDRLTSLGVEYQVTERLRVEAESGEKQTVDLVYKIER